MMFQLMIVRGALPSYMKSYIQLGQGNHYAVDLDGFDDFVNDNVLNSFEEKEEPYTGL